MKNKNEIKLINMLKKLFNIFRDKNDNLNYVDIICGHWIDKHGKQLFIKQNDINRYFVTILSELGNPYEIVLLEKITKKTINLSASIIQLKDRSFMLEVEAGNEEIGPTFNLFFVRLNKTNDRVNNYIIKPEVGMGLYDDWEDNLGVPWALPLEIYVKKE